MLYIKIFDCENERKKNASENVYIFGRENVLIWVVKITENCSITFAHENHH